MRPVFCNFSQTFHTFSHFQTPFQHPHPYFQPKNTGALFQPSFPIRIFQLKTRTQSNHKSRSTTPAICHPVPDTGPRRLLNSLVTPYLSTIYASRSTTPDLIGDEGNRTLISAMRPRRAPVTPRPLNHYIFKTYNYLKLPLIITYYILYRLPACLTSTFSSRISKSHKFNYSNTFRNSKYLSNLLRIERTYPACPQP